MMNASEHRRTLVTGGNGFIGSRVVRRLLEEGGHVRCLLRAESRTERIQSLPYETALGDVRDSAAVERAVNGCDSVIHLASPSSWTDINSPVLPDVVVAGTGHILRAALAREGVRVVFVSSATAINGSATPVVHDEESKFTLPLDRYLYPRVKREAEALCRRASADGLRVVMVNPTEVYGPNDTGMITAGTLADFANSAPAVVCTGGTSVAHVDDVAEGAVAALDKGRSGERYILGGENVSVEDLARTTLAILGRKPRTLKIPNSLLRFIARVGPLLRIPLPFNPAVVPYGTLFWYMSSDKAQRELGVSFRDARSTLADTVRWLREAGHIGQSR
ncbi:MAG: NAD-dependent epimerase/dehydratase family protein [Vicinamibacteria bacterium]|nr:NAD-dependent epimerase/dehydratase family protein [Vicinamibacteria bacterium]